ncbi:MAG: TetR/AcrR family transcriptional regulator [Clostridium sp.]|nr:TetR/AcrR family transcriptional regulator [Clostridium sp.]
MESNYNDTHQAILISAKKSFLNKGFERSNLREICKGANVTTGAFYRHFRDKETVFEALVEHAIRELKKSYCKSEDEIYKSLDDTSDNKIWDMTDESMIGFIDLIYKNYDQFKLLVSCADGTVYENFIHDISDIEVKHTITFMNKLKEKGYKIQNISEKEVHMLIQAYFTSIFEVIIHDYDKEEAKKCISTVVKFNTIGWKYIFGM